jgi:hypothetical protein
MYIRWSEKYTGIVHEEYFQSQEVLKKRFEELKRNSMVESIELTYFSLYKH